jgi:hypothetical protein
MESIKFCQSCSMPLTDPELLGTESDGSSATEYCKYCYNQGRLINPGMTMEEMKSLIIEKMENQHIPEDIIEAAVLRIPQLKRWKNKQNSFHD